MDGDRGNLFRSLQPGWRLLTSFLSRGREGAAGYLRAWWDPLGGALLGTAAVANVALLLYLRAVFVNLPLVLPFHFTASGEVDRIAPRGEIFKLPYIGLLVLLVNLALALSLHRHYRPASLILLSVALVVQLVFWWAALNIAY